MWSSSIYSLSCFFFIPFALLTPSPAQESACGLWSHIHSVTCKVPSFIILRHTSCHFHIRKFPKVREGKWLIPFIQCLTSPLIPHFPPPPCVNRKLEKEKLSESSSWKWRNPGTLCCRSSETTIKVSPPSKEQVYINIYIKKSYLFKQTHGGWEGSKSQQASTELAEALASTGRPDSISSSVNWRSWGEA